MVTSNMCPSAVETNLLSGFSSQGCGHFRGVSVLVTMTTIRIMGVQVAFTLEQYL